MNFSHMHTGHAVKKTQRIAKIIQYFPKWGSTSTSAWNRCMIIENSKQMDIVDGFLQMHEEPPTTLSLNLFNWFLYLIFITSYFSQNEFQLSIISQAFLNNEFQLSIHFSIMNFSCPSLAKPIRPRHVIMYRLESAESLSWVTTFL